MSKKFTLGRISKLTLGALVALMIFVLTGCTGAPGMMTNEVDRRHVNVVRSNWKMLQDDLDAVFLWDQPSRLSEMPVR